MSDGELSAGEFLNIGWSIRLLLLLLLMPLLLLLFDLGSDWLSHQVGLRPELEIMVGGFAPMGPNCAPKFSGFLISGRILPTGVTFVFCFRVSDSGASGAGVVTLELGPNIDPPDGAVVGPGVEETDPCSARSSDSE